MTWKQPLARASASVACIAAAVATGWFLRAAYDQREQPRTLVTIPRAATTPDLNVWEPVLQRLTMRLESRGGFVIAHDAIVEKIVYAKLYAVPKATPWRISCGPGLSVLFGGRIEVDIAAGAIDRENCAVLEPEVADRLRSILQES